MVSLCFNIGGHSFRTSTVLRQHRAGNYLASGDAFLMWDKDHQDGQLVVVPGLLRRRTMERPIISTCRSANDALDISAASQPNPP
jgi:lysozyme